MLARAGPRVEHLQRPQSLEGEEERRDAPAQRIGAADVAGGDPQQAGQIGGVPEPLSVGLAESDALRPGDPRVYRCLLYTSPSPRDS